MTWLQDHDGRQSSIGQLDLWKCDGSVGRGIAGVRVLSEQTTRRQRIFAYSGIFQIALSRHWRLARCTIEENKNDPCKLPPQDESRFLEYMRAIEGEGPQTTLMALIGNDGVQVPSPDELKDEELSAKLWEVIHAIHKHGSLLYSTDHLSDRELYKKLYEEILTEEYPIVPEGFPHAAYIDLLGFGGDEKDDQAYLKYYADEETRQMWAGEFNVRLPERAAPPFSRDDSLPR